MTVRDEMREKGGNIGWCVPYYDKQSEKYYWIFNGKANEDTGRGYFAPTSMDKEEITDTMRECDCRECPFFDTCEVMDDY